MTEKLSDPQPVPKRRLPLPPPWRELRVYDTLDSTQLQAARSLESGEDLRGVVLWSEVQSAGHGRQGRKWASGRGGLYVTATLPSASTLPDESLGWITLLPALGCARLVNALWRIEARIKWPNDVLAGGKKLAGVLGEVGLLKRGGDPPMRLLRVGMGLNWCNDVRDATGSAPYQAASLADHIPGLCVEGRLFFLEAWLARLARDVEALTADPRRSIAAFRREVGALLWNRFDKVALEHTEYGPVSGTLLGIGPGAAAIVSMEGGPSREIHCGQHRATPEPGLCGSG